MEENVKETAKVHTHDIAAEIMEQFEDVLETQDVTLTSPEDDEKEEGNHARIYGSTYDGLMGAIEGILAGMLKAAGVGEDAYVQGEFSGNY